MAEDGMFAPYRRLAFTVRGPFCTGDACAIHPALAALRFKVNEVHGTSARVRVGERYVVFGEYELPDSGAYVLSLAVFSKAFGAGAHLSQGSGRFDLSTEVLALDGNSCNGLGVVVGNQKTGKCNIVGWIMLQA